MSKKIGFGAVLAIVFGSQIGSGIFVLPATLAPFGMFGVFGWVFAGLGAMLLAFVFADLCSKFPQTGGPHVYVQQVFGRLTGFFVGWTYWLVSWTSTSVVIIAAVASLSVFFGNDVHSHLYLLLEILLLGIITAINCKSVGLAGRVESVLALLKFIPFVFVPIVLFCNFDVKNIALSPKYADFSIIKLIIMVTMESFWGFIGVECATAPAGAVENPSKTIPRAIIIGTFGVALIYFINNLSVMGVIPGDVLAASKSPYVDAINLVLGKNLSLIVSVITFIIMLGTANAWTLASAQISLGLAQEKLLPDFFNKKNKELAPYASVLISSIGMIPILMLSQDKNLSEQISNIIDFSVEVFLMVYAMCCLAFIKINAKNKKAVKTIIGFMALIFCLTMIINSPIKSIIVALLFAASGVFMLPFVKNKA
ncbi:MAG: amino acid permease [Holosporaceae bacterium]|jgi:APA family basic amino acid/polyamine antiporter|nr:amino acid permease [Holosporaceae bacterium]